jgi:hypothetical protein
VLGRSSPPARISARPLSTRFTKIPISLGPRSSGFLGAGQVLERWGVVPLFTAVVLGITWMAIVFAAITWRYSDNEPLAELAATST